MPQPGAGLLPPFTAVPGIRRLLQRDWFSFPFPPGMTQIFPLKQHQKGVYCSPASPHPPQAGGTSVTLFRRDRADGKCQRSLETQPESGTTGQQRHRGGRAPPGPHCGVRTRQLSHRREKQTEDAPRASQPLDGPQLHAGMLRPPAHRWEGFGGVRPSLPPRPHTFHPAPSTGSESASAESAPTPDVGEML